MPTRVLSFHSTYRCRHAGACCTSNWPIPVEADRLAAMRAAIASGSLRPAADAPFVESDDAPEESPALLATIDGRCVFYDAGAKRCGIQRALGHDALPLACRQFPRVSVHDPRGTSVTLSHYCPTAAALLHDSATVTIDASAPAFPAEGEYVGLDARASLPPLLRPDMLMDWESWWEWERLSVELLCGGEPCARAVRRLSLAVEHARTWSPADGPLISRVHEAFDQARRANPGPILWSEEELHERRGEILGAIPIAHQPPAAAASSVTVSELTLSRLLAAHAFANWTAHLGRGLRTWLRSVEAPLALIQSGLDVRTVDLWIRHLSQPQVLATTWSFNEVVRQ